MVDFKKAFNYVNHNILLFKLIKHGFAGNFINLIKDMYSKLKGTIKVNNMLFHTIQDTCGTNQGGPLSPSMFRFMLGDLKPYLHLDHGIVLGDQVIAHLLWADDMVLFADSPEGLQAQLNGLFKFCSRFQLIVNELKTKVMIFGKEKYESSFVFNGNDLEIVSKYKYLGVMINSIKTISGNIFREMYPYIADKAKKSCFANLKKCSELGNVSPKVACHLFDVYTVPVLNYGSVIWCKDKPIDDLERVQLMYLKYVLGVKNNTCSVAVLGEFGRFPIYISHCVSLIKYWCRLISMQEESLTKQAYLTLRQLYMSGYNSWLCNIVKILKKIDLLDYWENSSLIYDKCVFISDVKKCIFYSYVSEWEKLLYN